jgi:ribonuclease P protein component
MLAKNQRLSKKQFDEYFKSGKRFHFTHCTIIYTPLSTLHGSVVVGKKVSKKAVTRNTIRRRVYAQIRSVCSSTNATGVFIVIIKPAYIQLNRKAALADISAHIASVVKKT